MNTYNQQCRNITRNIYRCILPFHERTFNLGTREEIEVNVSLLIVSAITTGDTKRLVATQKVYGTLLITGRKTPAYVGYKPMMSANNQTWIVKLVNAGEFEMLMPNEVYYNIEFEVQDSKMLCVLGQVINIMEGGKTIGTFTVEDFSPMQLTFEDVPAASGK